MRHLRVKAAVHRAHVLTSVHDQIWHCVHNFHQRQLHHVKADAPALQMLQIARNLRLQKPSHLLSFGHRLFLATLKSVHTSAVLCRCARLRPEASPTPSCLSASTAWASPPTWPRSRTGCCRTTSRCVQNPKPCLGWRVYQPDQDWILAAADDIWWLCKPWILHRQSGPASRRLMQDMHCTMSCSKPAADAAL